MKTRKILFGLSAIALTLYTIEALINLPSWSDSWFYAFPWNIHASVKLFWAPYNWLLLGGTLLALVASLIKVEHPQPATKWHKYSTCAVALVSLAITIYGIVYAFQANWFNILHAPSWLCITGGIMGCIYLWALTISPNRVQLPHSIRLLMYFGIGCIGLVFLLQVASGIAYMLTGHLLLLHTWTMISWLRYVLPTILLCWYSIELFKESNISTKLNKSL